MSITAAIFGNFQILSHGDDDDGDGDDDDDSDDSDDSDDIDDSYDSDDSSDESRDYDKRDGRAVSNLIAKVTERGQRCIMWRDCDGVVKVMTILCL